MRYQGRHTHSHSMYTGYDEYQINAWFNTYSLFTLPHPPLHWSHALPRPQDVGDLARNQRNRDGSIFITIECHALLGVVAFNPDMPRWDFGRRKRIRCSSLDNVIFKSHNALHHGRFWSSG